MSSIYRYMFGLIFRRVYIYIYISVTWTDFWFLFITIFSTLCYSTLINCWELWLVPFCNQWTYVLLIQIWLILKFCSNATYKAFLKEDDLFVGTGESSLEIFLIICISFYGFYFLLQFVVSNYIKSFVMT